MPESIAQDTVVTVHYTLTNDAGEVVDSSRGREPLTYLHGHQNIVVGLERELTGQAAGAQLEVVVEPGEGYGERDPNSGRAVPKEAFPGRVEVGMQLFAEDGEGKVIPIWVTAVGDDTVEIDLNHPLAGVRLHFDVEIVELRDAKPEELIHGHPHGRTGDEGHHHHHH